ncbi:hypothetical protein QVD17_16967 [Tagetes erecta]|uniref:Reverse transcriptase zinc-binding domain-containing protein n=1 Tax=Tagetes erecta TaxID=13708 RepID=A0AAD8KSZ7_TARER|nr:hypothetical protein QVD17_16967 [Tagetes erecta]
MNIEKDLAKEGVNINSLIRRKVGNGSTTSFWKQSWFGMVPFMHLFPNLFTIERNKNAMVSQRISFNNNDSITFNWEWKRGATTSVTSMEIDDLQETISSYVFSGNEDSWLWPSESSGCFTTKSCRAKIENNQLNGPKIEVLWLRWVPLKVRSFVWRLYQGRVPVASNLITRGVNIPTVACQLCTLESEDVDHLFIHCPVSSQLWKMTSTWLGFPLDAEISIQSVCSKVYNYNGTSLRRKITSLITYSTIWTIWKTRNEWIFTKRAKTIGRLMEEVKLQSFNWINYRSSNLMVSWEIWCKSPAEGVSKINT